MEAMALNIPVISPTLLHMPLPGRNLVGVTIPWADNVSFDNLFNSVRRAFEVIEGPYLEPRELLRGILIGK